MAFSQIQTFRPVDHSFDLTSLAVCKLVSLVLLSSSCFTMFILSDNIFACNVILLPGLLLTLLTLWVSTKRCTWEYTSWPKKKSSFRIKSANCCYDLGLLQVVRSKHSKSAEFLNVQNDQVFPSIRFFSSCMARAYSRTTMPRFIGL